MGREMEAEAVLATVVGIDGIFAAALVVFIVMLWGRERVLKALNRWLAGPPAGPSRYGSLASAAPSDAVPWEVENAEGLPVARPTSESDDWDEVERPTSRALAVSGVAYLLLGLLAAAAHNRVTRHCPEAVCAVTAARLATCGLMAFGYELAADRVWVPSMRWWLSHALAPAGTLTVALYAVYGGQTQSVRRAESLGLFEVELPLVVPLVYTLGITAKALLDDGILDACAMIVVAVADVVLTLEQAAPALRVFPASLLVALLYIQIQDLLAANPDYRFTTVAALIAPPVALLVAAYAAVYAPPPALSAKTVELVVVDVVLAATLDLARLAVLAATSALAASVLDASKDALVALLATAFVARLGASNNPLDLTNVYTLLVLLAAHLAFALNALLLKPAPTPVPKHHAVVHFAQDHLNLDGQPAHAAEALVTL